MFSGGYRGCRALDLVITPMMIIFFYNDTATTDIYTLSLHDALPISEIVYSAIHETLCTRRSLGARPDSVRRRTESRSEEHTSELQSRRDLVCRLLLEKKKKALLLSMFWLPSLQLTFSLESTVS